MDGILAVESRLLPITIWLGLLLIHLLLHVREHMKELIFILRRGNLDAGS